MYFQLSFFHKYGTTYSCCISGSSVCAAGQEQHTGDGGKALSTKSSALTRQPDIVPAGLDILGGWRRTWRSWSRLLFFFLTALVLIPYPFLVIRYSFFQSQILLFQIFEFDKLSFPQSRCPLDLKRPLVIILNLVVWVCREFPFPVS